MWWLPTVLSPKQERLMNMEKNRMKGSQFNSSIWNFNYIDVLKTHCDLPIVVNKHFFEAQIFGCAISGYGWCSWFFLLSIANKTMKITQRTRRRIILAARAMVVFFDFFTVRGNSLYSISSSWSGEEFNLWCRENICRTVWDWKKKNI